LSSQKFETAKEKMRQKNKININKRKVRLFFNKKSFKKKELKHKFTEILGF